MVGDIIELLKVRLTFEQEQVAVLKNLFLEICVELAPILQKVHTEAMDYSDLERLLIADMVAYRYTSMMISKNASDRKKSAPLKKVKADVVEVEYELKKDGSTEEQNSLNELKKAICNKAIALKITLPLCEENQSIHFPKPFIIVA